MVFSVMTAFQLLPMCLAICTKQTTPPKLLAALRALQVFTLEEATKVAICTNSQYVILGTSGATHHLKIKGWVGSCGPVSSVPLSDQLLVELDNTNRVVHWAKVPSHVTIDGNNEADHLAEQGCFMHPKIPRLCTPKSNFSTFSTPRAPKRP